MNQELKPQWPTIERVRELQQQTAHPESQSVAQAMLQLLNECNQARAAIAPQPVAQAGWKLVPVEPTQEMCCQGQWKAQEWPKSPLRIVPIWKAMLAASPSATSLGGEQP